MSYPVWLARSTADNPRLAATTHTTSPDRTPTTVDNARRRPPRNKLRTTTSVSGPGRSTISAAAAAKARSAVTTTGRYLRRLPVSGQQLLFLVSGRSDAGPRCVASRRALRRHPLVGVARGLRERPRGEAGSARLRERRAHLRPPVRGCRQRQLLRCAHPLHVRERPVDRCR